MSDQIYRTLEQSRRLRDYSNYTLRFNRTMPGGWRPERPDTRPARYFWLGYVALLTTVLLVLL